MGDATVKLSEGDPLRLITGESQNSARVPGGLVTSARRRAKKAEVTGLKSTKLRIREVHFYEWYVSRWQGSTAHDELDACGRGIYREMLDACYTQGSVTSDLDTLCRKCSCTRAELDARWALIRKHFSADRKGENRLTNKFANAYRSNFFAFLREQSRKGGKGGRPRSHQNGEDKASAHKDIETTGFSESKAEQNPPKNYLRKKKEELPKNGNQKPGDVFEFFCATFIGEIPDDLHDRFLGYVTGHPDELLANLPLWMQTRKYQEGYGTNADKFLKSGIWKKPPREELYGKREAQQEHYETPLYRPEDD